ncbi:unnamed protein product [Fraxinus pennsylvanica]|uniref:Uncharacterized protein n=1 Tax=Fraxinus pennsylvanica TaxID=56036 RepID=A0AAD1YTT7_9LAMI|nr:unnamed protein product [Fraxinus pennsylvanica]
MKRAGYGSCFLQIKKKFNIKGSDSSLDDCLPSDLPLRSESRTLEMNSVQDGIWHGRGDTICVGSYSEGNKALFEFSPPFASLLNAIRCKKLQAIIFLLL